MLSLWLSTLRNKKCGISKWAFARRRTKRTFVRPRAHKPTDVIACLPPAAASPSTRPEIKRWGPHFHQSFAKKLSKRKRKKKKEKERKKKKKRKKEEEKKEKKEKRKEGEKNGTDERSETVGRSA